MRENRQNEGTKQAKRWVHECSREHFSIKTLLRRHTFVLCILLGGGGGEEHPGPLKSISSLNDTLVKKGNAPLQWGPPVKRETK